VLPTDWSRFVGRNGAARPPRFLSELTREVAATSGAPVSGSSEHPDVRERLEGAPPGQRRKLLLGYVRVQARKVLGLASEQRLDDRQPLQALGLDSLMAVELRNLVGAGLTPARGLPATVVFDHPSVEALTDYLAHWVFGWSSSERSEAAADPATGEADTVLGRIEDLSDDDVDRLLDDRATRQG
jgi:hypothetical protein